MVADFAEVPLPHLRGRHGVDEHAPQLLAEPVVVGEEERLVRDNRAADGASELILLERRLLLAGAVREEVVGVELVVAQELVGDAVKRVAAGFGDDVDLPAGIPPLIGGIEVGLNLEFLDRLDVRAKHRHERQPRVVVDPVVQVVVRVFPVAVDEQLRAWTEVIGPRAAHDGAAHAGAGARHARAERGQLHEVASAERQVLNLFLLDHGAEHRRLRLEQRRGARDRHGLADQADFELQVDGGALIDLQLDAGALDLAKPLDFGVEPVAARLQRGKDVCARRARGDGAADAGRLVRQHDRDAGHDGTRGVANRSYQIGRGHLGVCHCRRQHEQRAKGE